MTELLLEKGNEHFSILENIIKLIENKKEAEPFREPVDYEGLGLTDYPKIVSKMMDLGTLSRNLQEDLYKNVRECLDDLQLIWDNCKLYNVEFSKIYKLAQKLEEYTKKLVEDKFGVIEYGKNNPSYKLLADQMQNMNVEEE